MRTINACHILSGIGPLSFGIGPVALHLVRELRLIGVNAYIMCLDGEEEIEKAARSYDLPRDCLLGYKPLGPVKIGYSVSMVTAIKHRIGGNIDILHQHGIWTAISHVTNVWRERYGHPTLIAPHGSLEAWALKRSRWKKRLACIAYESRNLKGATCFHAVSESEAIGIKALGIETPVFHIPNGIGDKWINSEGNSGAFREKYGISREARIILFIGRISPVKNLSMLIESMSLIRQDLAGWRLVVAGVNEFGYQEYVQAIINNNGLNDRVFFIGQINNETKRDALAAADFLVLPSIKEASPLVVLEALGVGVPVFTTKGTPWNELEGRDCGWWVDVDKDSMATVLKKVLRCPKDELIRMGRNGRQLIVEKYRWEHAAHKAKSIYEYMLGTAHEQK